MTRPAYVIFSTLWLVSLIVGQEKKFVQQYNLHLPPKPAFGASPDRSLEPPAEFVLPDGFEVVRADQTKGLRVIKEELGGMERAYWAVNEVGNGVKIEWKVKNSHSLPALGRDSSVWVELTGKRKDGVTMKLSNEYEDRRKRFLDRFYYGGLVAEWVNEKSEGRQIHFADQTIYMGLALAVFSTEAAVLKDQGKKTDEVYERIKEILDAFDQLDEVAEGKFVDGKKGEKNGFFVRDNITGPDDVRLRKKFRKVDSDWQNKENAAPSGDQLFGLMFGLYCVTKYTDNEPLKQRAKDISARIYDYAQRTYFNLQLPDGKSVDRGAEVWWTCSLLHGTNKAITGKDRFEEARYKVNGTGPERKLNDIGAIWADPLTQRLIVEKSDVEIPTEVGPKLKVNSFAIHLLLSAIAPSDVWSQTTVAGVAKKNNHHLADLIYCQTHNSLPRKFTRNDVQKMLTACPADGPRASLGSETGWQQDNRWIRCTKIKEKNEGDNEFNGLDWLLLHNFDQLVFVGP